MGIARVVPDRVFEPAKPFVRFVAAFFQEEIGVDGFRTAQYAVLHLDFGDADAPLQLLSEPRITLFEERVFTQFPPVGAPAVAVAQQSDEEGPRVVDLVQAYLHDPPALGFLLGDAPAQVEFDQRHVAPGGFPAQQRENPGHQVVPLGLHVPEGRGDEDADLAVLDQVVGGRDHLGSILNPSLRISRMVSTAVFRSYSRSPSGNSS